MTFRVVILICLIPAICCAELSVNILENSKRIYYLGDPVQLGIEVAGDDSDAFEGVLVGELVDYWGTQIKGFEYPLTLKQPAADIEITIQTDVPEVGYYQIDIKLISNGRTIIDRKKIWSIAIFDYPRDFPMDSPLGTFTIGDMVMLADIVPKGFYKNMAQIGVRWGTIVTWWRDLEPEKGKYNWVNYDSKLSHFLGG